MKDRERKEEVSGGMRRGYGTNLLFDLSGETNKPKSSPNPLNQSLFCFPFLC